MTNKEAIKALQYLISGESEQYPPDYDIPIRKSIEALEKQEPKKTLFLIDNPNYSPFDDSPEKFYGCPACHDRLMKNYPCKCGQMIDWGEDWSEE